MKALIIGGLCAALGFAAAHGFAQEPQWRASGSSPTNHAITLSRPVPAGDGTVAPASFTPVPAPPATAPPASSPFTLARPVPLFRGKAPDIDDGHQLMPIGPIGTNSAPGVAKPMSAVQGVPPRTFAAPVPRLIGTPGMVVSETPFLDACEPVAGDDCVVDCCVDACGPWWRRLGQRVHGWQGWDNNVCEDPCCLPRPRAWVRAEYLLWHVSNQDMPALLTTEGAPIRPIDGGAGTLPMARVLFGEGDAGDEVRSGVRTQFGFWLPCRNLGFDFGGFMLIRRSNSFETSSDGLGNPVLARPFFDASLDAENAQIVSYPGEFAGRFAYESTTRVWGVDANFRRKLGCGPRYWVDGFLGYRHLQVHDTIDITEQITDINRAPGDVLGFGVRDSFETRNQFNGLQLGFEGELRLLRRWFLAGNFKVAVGNVHQTLNINGSTTFMLPGGGMTTGSGGLFALNSNIGRYENDEFAIVPEFGIKLGLDVTDHLRVYAGYNLLCLSSAIRAGDQIDRRVNPAMLPDIVTPPGLNPPLAQPVRPSVLFRDSSFWAGGAQFGLEYHW